MEPKLNLGHLPPEIITQYLVRLSPKDLANYCQTSQTASEYCQSDAFWKDKYQYDFGLSIPKNPTRKWIDIYKQRKMVKNSPISVGGAHYAVIDDQGILYMAGKNRSGQLGDGTKNNSVTPIAIKSFTEKVISVSCGDIFTIAITEDGKIYGWGLNTFNKGEETRFLKPTLIDNLKEHRAIKVSCGGEGWAVILDNGSVYYSISLHEVHDKCFTGIVSLEDAVIDISSETYNLAMVTEKGSLYFFGHEFAGMSGGISGTMDKPIFTPTYISLPSRSDGRFVHGNELSEKIKQVSLSGDHIMVLTTNGVIFAWGENTFGQIGIGIKGEKESLETTGSVWKPRRLITLLKFSYINTGLGSSSAITTDGRLYVWGGNSIMTSLTSYFSKTREEVLKAGITTRGYGHSNVRFPVEIDIKEEYKPVGKRLRINYVSLSYYFSIVSTEDGVVNFLGPTSLFS